MTDASKDAPDASQVDTKGAAKNVSQRFLYIHGFNSAPASRKARQFIQYCESRQSVQAIVPALSWNPAQAIRQLEEIVTQEHSAISLLVGSSLGGYYATYLAEKYNLKAVLINPAVSPCEHLGTEFLGAQKNYYTEEEYEFTMTQVDFLRTLDCRKLSDPRRYMLLVETGDEVLDYTLAVERYAGATQQVFKGGDHSFQHFEALLPDIIGFAEAP